jgi:hypothetical protein
MQDPQEIRLSSLSAALGHSRVSEGDVSTPPHGRIWSAHPRIVRFALGKKAENAVDGLTTTQAARRLGVSAVRIHQILCAGQLRYMETSLGRLIDPADLERLAAERERTRRKKEG